MESRANAKPRVSVVISSYNDRDIIEPYFKAISKVLGQAPQYDWELVYVDDGSTDGSVDVLKTLAVRDCRVCLVVLGTNVGQQKAFFAGLQKASGNVLITLDGDYQYEPECLVRLTDKILQGFDLVSGIRVRRKDSPLTNLASWVGQFFVRRALPYPVKDFGAVKAYSRALIDRMVQETDGSMPHGAAFGLADRIAEIPVGHRPRPSGRSKWTFGMRLRMYRDLSRMYRRPNVL